MASRKEIPIALWRRIELLIPQVKRSPKGGRPRISDQQALNGVIYVRRTGMPWEELLLALGDGSGMTCWRRLRDWQASGVWHRLHQVLLAELGRAEKLDLSRASLDAASVPPPWGRVHRTEPDRLRQTRQQAASDCRPQRRAFSGVCHWRPSPRVGGVRGVGRCFAADWRQSREPTTLTRQTARRQGIRHRSLPRPPQETRQHCADPPQADRAQRPFGPSSLGRRAHTCLVRRGAQAAHRL